MAIKLLRHNSPPYYYSLKATFFPPTEERKMSYDCENDLRDSE